MALYKGERLNSITHLLGAIASLVGLVFLVIVSAKDGDPWKIVSFSIYGATLLFLYIASTLYHSTKGRAKKIFMMLDYHGIYLLIAGTYTPFLLVTLRGPIGWTLFAIIWTLAIIGIAIDSLPQRGRRIIPIVIYLVMGWLITVALFPLMRILTLPGFLCLLLGGCLYTIGVIFFLYDMRVKHFHGIWHIFVMAGSICHYFTVLYYVS